MQNDGCVGVILAGGTGSRLYPCTKVTNKHLLPIGEMPMIFYPIKKLVGAGVTDIMIVTGTEHVGDFISLLGSGKEFGCALTYRVQDEAGGIAQALGLAERFANGQPMCVILGDNIFADDISEILSTFAASNGSAHVVLKEVEDPERFGVAVFEKLNGSGVKIRAIIEKPKVAPSNFAVTGIYCYPSDVFDIIRRLKPSSRGELEITDVNNEYIRQGRMMCSTFKGYWSDAGTFESLSRANELVRELAPSYYSSNTVSGVAR